MAGHRLNLGMYKETDEGVHTVVSSLRIHCIEPALNTAAPLRASASTVFFSVALSARFLIGLNFSSGSSATQFVAGPALAA